MPARLGNSARFAGSKRIWAIVHTCVYRYPGIMCIYIYAYIHTYIHTYMHTYICHNLSICLYIFIDIQSYVYSYVCVSKGTYTYTYTDTDTYTYSYTFFKVHLHARANVHIDNLLVKFPGLPCKTSMHLRDHRSKKLSVLPHRLGRNGTFL